MLPLLYKFEKKTQGNRLRSFVATKIRQRYPYFRFRRYFINYLIRPLTGDIVRVSVGGVKLNIDLRDESFAESVFFEREWEPQETFWFLRLLRPGMVVVDIGAHVGYYTILASQIVGLCGRVIAFEPAPETARLLRKNILENNCTDILVEESAVTDQSGDVLFYLSPTIFGDHRIYEPRKDDVYSARGKRSHLTVRGVSLDAYLSKNNQVDFVKIDIQGGEHAALQGMRRVLQDNAKIILMLEFWPYGLLQAGVSPAIFLRDLRREGFQFYDPSSTQLIECSDESILERTHGILHVNLIASRVRLG